MEKPLKSISRGYSPTYDFADESHRRTWGDTLRKSLGLDHRSLAFYRVAIGMVIICDMIDRWKDMYVWYTDDGMLSRRVLTGMFWDPGYVCLHMINGTLTYQALLFLLQIFAACMMLVGYRTWFWTVVSWYLEISLQIRNPLVLHNGDVYIRCFLFFSMFIPLNKCFSVDAWLSACQKKKSLRPPKRSGWQHNYVFGLNTIAMIFMLGIVYCISVIHKYENAWDIWFVRGDVTYFAINLMYFRRWLGNLLAWPRSMLLLRLMTWSVLGFEALGPLLAVSPYFNTACRLLSAFGIAALHAGFGWAMRLEIFYITGMSCPMVLLPSWLWDVALPWCFARVDRSRRFLRPTRVQFHSRMLPLVEFVRVFGLLPEGIVRPQPMADASSFSSSSSSSSTSFSQPSAGREDVEYQRGVYLRTVDEKTSAVRVNSDAIVSLLQLSPLLYAVGVLMSLPLCRSIADAYFRELDANPTPSSSSKPQYHHSAYSAANAASSANNLSSAAPASSNDASAPPGPHPSMLRRKRTLSRISKRFWSTSRNAIAGFFIVYCLMWNFANLGIADFPLQIRWMAFPTLLYQSWNMFAPPPQTDWYHRLYATVSNINGTVDLMGGQNFYHWKINPIKPGEKITLYTNYNSNRWNKLFEGMTFSKPWGPEMFQEMGRFACREWNRRHAPDGYRLEKFHVDLVSQHVLPGFIREPEQPETIYSHIC